MDLKKLTRGEMILGVSSLVLIILSFLPLWAKVETEIGEEFEDLGIDAESSTRFSLWDSYGFMAKLAIFLAIAIVILIVVRQLAPDLKAPVPLGQIYAGFAGLSLLLMLISVLTGPEGEQGSADLGGFGSVEVSRGLIGLILGVAAAGAMAYGAWMHMSEEGSAPAGAGPTPTPPPPAS